jgi:hypothetical protein
MVAEYRPSAAPRSLAELAAVTDNSLLLRFFEQWLALAGDGAFPPGDAFEPEGPAFARGHVVMVDLVGTPPRFRFRHVGDKLVPFAGIDMTGKWVDELPNPEHRRSTLEGYRWVAENARPAYASSARERNRKPYFYEAIRLPLSQDGHTVDRLVTCTSYALRMIDLV